MEPQPARAHTTSAFMQGILPLLLDRYEISFLAEGDCLEYFLEDKATHEVISQALILSMNRFANRIEVIRFYPELNKQPESKYLSAACFHLLVHHFAHHLHLADATRVFVRTRPEVFRRFYAHLADYDFHEEGLALGDTVEVVSGYHEEHLDTSAVHACPGTGVPFLVE